MNSNDDNNNFNEKKYKEILNKNTGPRMSVSAEVYSEFAAKNYTFPFYSKDQNQRLGIKNALKNCFLFSSVDDKHLEIIIDAFKYAEFQPGTKIICEGDLGDDLYLIEEGTVRVTKVINCKDQFMCEMNKGEIFGELALMYSAPRAATVTAIGRVKVWKLIRECFNHFVKNAAVKKRDMYGSFISKIDLLKGINDYEKLKLVDSLEIVTFGNGTNIITQDESGDFLIILVEGKAVAYKDGIEIKRYSSGDYFGELALMYSAPRAATVTAIEDCKVAILSRVRCTNILGPIEPIVKKNIEKYKQALLDVGISPEFLDAQVQKA